MSNVPLTLRHHCFVQEHLRDGNATQAYAWAGIIEPNVRTHRKPEQRVTPRPARPRPGLSAGQRKRSDERRAA